MASRISIKDRRAAAAAMATDKFVGLVEKQPSGGGGGGGGGGRAAAAANPPPNDPSIRSSSIDAPFGQASTRPAKAGAGGSGNAAHDRNFIHARRTGQLVMDNMSLRELPPAVCNLYDEGVMTANEKIWETTDLLSISMQHNALESLPSAVSNLVHLQVLLLAHNKLRSLPSELMSLANLKKIDVSHNTLQQLPNDIASLQALVELNVSHNPSLRMLPDSLCDLGRLEVLTAESCALESLPEDLGVLRQLLRINVNANKLTALPSSVADLTRLASLEAKGNRIGSASNSASAASSSRRPAAQPGVPSLAALSSLTLLDLSENVLTSLPPLPRSGKLAQAFFGFNQLTSCDAIVDCAGLVALNINNNRLESLPRGLGRPDSALKICDVSNNDLSDIPGELGLIKGLNKILVDGNPLRKFPRGKLQGGQGIEAFKKYLITRIDPATLARIGGDEAEEALGSSGLTTSSNPNVEYAVRDGAAQGRIDLSKIAPPLTAFPTSLFALQSIGEIQSLDLSNQQIPESEIPSQLSMCRRLRVFTACNVGWKQVPLALCSLLGLQELVLSGNAISVLPSNLAALQSLARIELRQNAFVSFPPVLCQLARTLTHISFANNRLTSLPADFCSVFGDKLEQLDVSGCQLTALPDGWRWMNPRFELLNAENNQLAAVPLELGLLPGLRTLQLHGNPQRTVLYAVLSKGTPAILAALKNKIPSNSELLDPTVQRPRPTTPDDPDAIDVDTSQRGVYARSMEQGSAGPSAGRNAPARHNDDRDDYARRDAPLQRPMRDARDNDYDDRSDRFDRRSSREFQQQDSRRGYDDDRPRADPRYNAAPSRSQQPAAAASYGRAPQQQQQQQYRNDPDLYHHDRDPRYDVRSQQPMQRAPVQNRAPQQQQAPRRDDFAQADQRGYAPQGASSSAAAASSSLASELAQLNANIAALSSELENNMSLGGPRKLIMKKELAAAMAERNRKQAQQGR